MKLVLYIVVVILSASAEFINYRFAQLEITRGGSRAFHNILQNFVPKIVKRSVSHDANETSRMTDAG